MKLSRLVPKAKKLTASRTAAVDTIRPVRARPWMTASPVDARCRVPAATREQIIDSTLDLVGRGLIARE